MVFPFFVLSYNYQNTDGVVALKITMEMSRGAYEVNQITRTEGKIEIHRRTGMNEGSAQGKNIKEPLIMRQISSYLKILKKILV